MKDQNLINENELYLVDGSEIDKYTFTATAGQNTFTIPFEFDGSSSLTLYYNGVMMKENDNYTIADNVITLVDWTAEEGDYITVMGIQGAAAIDFAKDADKYMKQMEDKAAEVKADLASTATTAKNDITSTASTSKAEINTIISTGKNDLNNLISTLPDNWNNVMDKNSANVMGANGKITMDNSYIPSGNNDLVTMKYVSENSHKVGDILTTARTDLGDDWLLCNGDVITQNTYPELNQVLLNGLCNFRERNSRIKVTSTPYTYTLAVRNRGNITEALVTDMKKNVWYINLSGGGTWEQIVDNDAQKIIAANNVFFRRYNGGIFYCDENSDPRLDESYHLLSGVSTNLIDVVYLNGKYCIATGNQLYFYNSLSEPPVKPASTSYNSAAIGIDGNNIILTNGTTCYFYSTEGVLIETVNAPNIVKGIVSKLGNGYVNLSVQTSTSTSNYSTMTVKYFDSLSGDASVNQTFNGPRGENRPIYITHDSVVDSLYAPLVDSHYIDSKKNINPFFAGVNGACVAYSATNDKIYALVYTYKSGSDHYCTIFVSPRQYSSSIPQWTPVTGLYSYIKAKS